MTETCTRTEFAQRMGWKSAGQVSNLIRVGIIVLTDDRKRVCVAESIAAIEAARDPSKAGVRARHAAARASHPGAGENDESKGDTADAENINYQSARARKEHFSSLEAEADYRHRIGELMKASEVHAVVADVLVTLRTAIEPIGAVLAPQLAATSDETVCRTMIEDRINEALSECARRFDEMSA